MAGESKEQAKIIVYLKTLGWYVIKVVAGTREGIPDIIACDPKGKFWAFEVKHGKNTASKLQEYNLNQITLNNGNAYAVWSLDEVKSIILNNM